MKVVITTKEADYVKYYFKTNIDVWSQNVGLCQTIQNKILKTRSKTLCIIMYALWYILNHTIHEDLEVQFIIEIVRVQARRHKS